MNLVARQNFGRKSSPAYNTEIGGVSGTITTASALATKLGISVDNISNFTIVGSDIKCKITGSYAIPTNAFYLTSNGITYYRDYGGLVTSVGVQAFRFEAITELWFPYCATVGDAAFQISGSPLIYIPRCTALGSTVGNNAVFSGNPHNARIYVPTSLQTVNAGSPDGDLTNAISNGGTVVYVTNFTAPNAITDLSSGTIYNTAIQLNFTAPSSTNAIDYYELYNNGVFIKNITASGQNITGLNPSTNYNFTVVAVDIFYNKSVVSNSLSVSTLSTMTDYDAIAYVKVSENLGYEDTINTLFTSLKSNSLYPKIQAFYPFLGTTAAQHKWNAKNPLDTNAAFRLTFSGGGTFSDNGYQCNGSNAYANTYLVPSSVQNVNSNGLTLACGTNNAAASSNVVEMGAYNGASQASYLMVKNNNTNYKRRTALCAETPEVSQSGINESRGVFTGSRQSSTNTDLFVNGSQVATANQGGSLPTIAIFIGGLNFGGAGVTLSNQRIQFTAIHEGLSDSEVSTLHTIINTFENALGRKTW